MYKDLSASHNMMEEFKTYSFEDNSIKPDVEITVVVLTTVFWPTLNLNSVIPKSALSAFEYFKRYLLSNHIV
jgi:hypothetical protein